MKKDYFDETIFSFPKGMTVIPDFYQYRNVLAV